jgi:phosphoribosylanthranilate isomerase
MATGICRKHAPLCTPDCKRRPHHIIVKASSQQNTTANSSIQNPPYIKVCGITNAEDAGLAASTGANLIGMILWPKAARSVSTDTAKSIASVARRHNAEPVAVFVDEDADTIISVCQAAGIKIAQLHGDGARAALPHLPASLAVIYVMHADTNGILQTPIPDISSIALSRGIYKIVDWVLLDSLKGGSGERFDWTSLQPPLQMCSKGWLLAGGLGPGNVRDAVQIAKPSGVDVSSGVCCSDGLKKDVDKVVGFVNEAREAFGGNKMG